MNNYQNKTKQQLIDQVKKLQTTVKQLQKQQLSGRVRTDESGDKALRESEVCYRRLFETAQDGMLILDANTGKIMDANPFIREILGYKIEELVGKQLWEIGTFKDVVENKDKLRELQAQGYVRYEDLPLKSKSGRKVPVEFVSNTYQAGDKAVIQCNIREIGERKKAEAALRKSEEKYRLLHNSIRDAILVADTNRNIVDYNHAFGELFGYRKEEILGKKTVFVYAHEEEFKDLGKGLKEHYGDKPFLKTVHYKKKSGEIFLGETAVFYLRDDQGNVTGFIGLIRDITERKKAEDALRESENYLRSIFKAAPVGIGIVSNRVLNTVNETMCEMLGYTKGELEGKDAGILYPSEKEYEYVGREKYRQIKQHGTGTVETRFQRKDGKVIDVLLSSSPIDPENPDENVTFAALDITEHKKAEEKLIESEKSLLEAQRIANIGNWSLDLSTGQLQMSDEMFRLIGINNKSEVLDVSEHEKYYTPQSWRRFLDAVEKARKTGESYEIEMEFADKAAGCRYAIARGETLLDEQKNVIAIRGTLQDITERKEYEIELQKINAFIQTVLDNLPIGIALNKFDAGTATYMNKKFEEIYGWPAEELKNVAEFFKKVYPDPEYRKILMNRVLTDIQSGDPSKMHWEDCEITHKDGSKHIVNAQNIPLIEQNTMVSTVLDITEQKEAKEALIKSEEKYRSIFHNSALGIFRSTPEGRYEEVNEAFANILGFDSPQKMIDEVNDISELYKHPSERKKIIKEFADKGFVEDYEIEANHPHKETVWISVNGKQQQNPEGRIYYEGTIQDITERKLAEKELEDYKKHLEALVKERTAELEKQNQELERFNKLFVGREFRIKELKEKIKELEKELGNQNG